MSKYWNIHLTKIWDTDLGVYSFYLLPSISFNKDDVFNNEENFDIRIEWLIWCLYMSNRTCKPIKIRKRWWRENE